MTIFRNLVNNALKFTNKEGQVILRALLSNGVAKIQVEDTGIGMPEGKITNLFEVKENRNTWGTNGEKGLGLGIQLAYEFTNLNKGEIYVDSQVGVGTTFTVELEVVN